MSEGKIENQGRIVTQNTDLLKLLRDKTEEALSQTTKLNSNVVSGHRSNSSNNSGPIRPPQPFKAGKTKGDKSNEYIKSRADNSRSINSGANDVFAVVNPELLRAIGIEPSVEQQSNFELYSPRRNQADFVLETSDFHGSKLLDTRSDQKESISDLNNNSSTDYTYNNYLSPDAGNPHQPPIYANERSPQNEDYVLQLNAEEPLSLLEEANKHRFHSSNVVQNPSISNVNDPGNWKLQNLKSDNSQSVENHSPNNMLSTSALNRLYIESPTFTKAEEEEYRFVSSRIDDYGENQETHRNLDENMAEPSLSISPNKAKNNRRVHYEDSARYEDVNESDKVMQSGSDNGRQYVVRPSEPSRSAQNPSSESTITPRQLPQKTPGLGHRLPTGPTYDPADEDELEQEAKYQVTLITRIGENTKKVSDLKIPKLPLSDSDEEFARDSLDYNDETPHNNFVKDSLDLYNAGEEGTDKEWEAPHQSYHPTQNYLASTNKDHHGHQQSPPDPYHQVQHYSQSPSKDPHAHKQLPSRTYDSPNKPHHRHQQPLHQNQPNQRYQHQGHQIQGTSPDVHNPVNEYNNESCEDHGDYEVYSQQPQSIPQRHPKPQDSSTQQVDESYYAQGELYMQQPQQSAPQRSYGNHEGPKWNGSLSHQAVHSQKPNQDPYDIQDQRNNYAQHKHSHGFQEVSYETRTHGHPQEPPVPQGRAYLQHKENYPPAGNPYNAYPDYENSGSQDDYYAEPSEEYTEEGTLSPEKPGVSEIPKLDFVENNRKNFGRIQKRSYQQIQTIKKEEVAKLDNVFIKPKVKPKKKQPNSAPVSNVLDNRYASSPQLNQKPTTAEELWAKKANNLSTQKGPRKKGKLTKYPSDGGLPIIQGQGNNSPNNPRLIGQPPNAFYPDEQSQLISQQQHGFMNSPARKPLTLEPISRELITDDGQRISVDVNLKLLSPPTSGGSNNWFQDQTGWDSYGHRPVGVPYQMNPGYEQQGTRHRDYPDYEDYPEARHDYPSSRNYDSAPEYIDYSQPTNLPDGRPVSSPYKVIPPIHSSESSPTKPIDPEDSYVVQYRRQKEKQTEEPWYKIYNLKDYRKMQKEVQLGSLGPDLDNTTYKERIEKFQRQSDYARMVNERNKKQASMSRRPPSYPRKEEKSDDTNRRKIAVEYSKSIPKPVIKANPNGYNSYKVSSQIPLGSKLDSPKPKIDMINLENLQQRHERDKQNVAVIQQNLEIQKA